MHKVIGFIDILVGFYLILFTFVLLYPYSKLFPLYSASGMILPTNNVLIVTIAGLIMISLSIINFIIGIKQFSKKISKQKKTSTLAFIFPTISFIVGSALIGLLTVEVTSPIYQLTNSLSNP